MPTVSIAIIAHNEEEKLPAALKSAAWADEVVVVDCGSSDGTAAAAARSGARIFTRPNSMAVYVNKQFAADQAVSDWIFILDADEEISPELAAEIKEAVAAAGEVAAFKLPRKNFYFGRWLRHGGKYPDTQLRLFRRGRARFAQLPVHERLEVDGQVSALKTPLHHYHCASSADMEKKRLFYREMLVLSYGLKKKTPFSLLLRPFTRFFGNYLLKFGFLDGREGLKTALMDFCIVTDSVVKYFLDFPARAA
ncbi:MAG TPA: glycosyltransferase family 2 protein [Elusimicrobiales bacterium]|nr:glycosyltransferase family 2 protein [Elusimicrobiales bacterium]